MIPKIIYEDEQVLVVDKPSGWITNEAKTVGKTPVLQTWIKENYQFPVYHYQECRNGIVHRLDKETSGLLIVAKTKKAFEDIQVQFKERKVKKTYTALVHGGVEFRKGSISAPVGRLPWNRERFGVLVGGRTAETKYEVKKMYKRENETFSLLKLEPKTGRTHQLRIHLKHIGHPIVSDEFYAGRKTARADRKWCPRLFLHASELKIKNPTTGRVVNFKSRLSFDLKQVIKLLSQK